jgi:hypothetical protein
MDQGSQRHPAAVSSSGPIKAINRTITAEQITVENTEDSDLATISHDRELFYNLHESVSSD